MLHPPIRAVLSVQPTRIIPITTSPHSYSSALQNCHTHITTMLTSQTFSCHTVLLPRLHHPFTPPFYLRPCHSPAMSRLRPTKYKHSITDIRRLKAAVADIIHRVACCIPPFVRQYSAFSLYTDHTDYYSSPFVQQCSPELPYSHNNHAHFTNFLLPHRLTSPPTSPIHPPSRSATVPLSRHVMPIANKIQTLYH